MKFHLSEPILVMLLILIAQDAHAHAFPQTSIPKVGSTSASAPKDVRITFDANLEPLFSSVRIKNRDKQVISDAPSHISSSDHKTLVAPLKSLSPGKYYVYWSVVATDGHRTEGHYSFHIQ